MSPVGDLYGILSYNTAYTAALQSAYKFNFITGQWSIIYTVPNVTDIKFDKVGNVYYIDNLGNVFNSQNASLLQGVQDFEVTVGKNLFAVS